LKDSVVISFLGLIQAFLTLGYQIFILNIFGLNNELDIYFASNSINFILVSIAVGAINMSITPILIVHYRNKNIRKLGELASSIFNTLFLVFLIIAIFQYCFAPYILRLILPGFEGGNLEIAIKLFRMQAFLSIFTIVSSVLLALHYTFNMLYRSIAYPLMAQAIQILFVWLFYDQFGVFVLLYSLIINQLITFIFFAFPFVRLYRFKIILNSELQEASQKIFPLLISSSFSKSNILVDRFFASSLTAGSITLLYYGEKIIRIVSDFINRGISLVSLRKFSMERDNNEEFQRLFYLVFESMIFIVVPVTVMIFYFVKDVLNIIVLSNKLTDGGVEDLYWMIISFIGVFIGGSLNATITNAFYAKGLTKLVSKVNVILQIFGIAMKIILFFVFGLWGLPIAFSITSVLGVITFLFLYDKHIYSNNYWLLFKYSFKMIVISIVSLFVPLILSNFIVKYWVVKLVVNLIVYVFSFMLLTLVFEKKVSLIIYDKLKMRLNS
jgi:putative peptidoglycan lipid II flippase